ncbi:EBDP4, emopamil-binding protein [Lindgomyces ingoldianus]|uniref:EBDP4, emopamil-binding protein n=1 Tax=Lindgomyces ingoldianus TaxID=673940 RepID=A0ACB6QS27_9PLEO|nr:EBDP4, emopamil-binding protein [Lindgomyces ingoldianus]KAF2469794.1 EBDP4, emopamil-binding protein [Lindgomyces ingoldianus]
MPTATETPFHPYYPIEAEIVGYLANEWNTLELCSMFSAGCAVIFVATYLAVKRLRPHVSTPDLATVMWFVLCGCIHLFFEGYFAYNFRRMGGMQDLFGQLWKEYSLSDSRYLTQDAFVLCMETITAIFWGPLSFLTAALVATDHPLRYPLQTIVSLGQLYGDVLYYATSLFDHMILQVSYSRPEAAYYWGYFVFMNSFWIVIPLYLLCTSVSASARAVAALNKVEMTLKELTLKAKGANGVANGAVKKHQ